MIGSSLIPPGLLPGARSNTTKYGLIGVGVLTLVGVVAGAGSYHNSKVNHAREAGAREARIQAYDRSLATQGDVGTLVDYHSFNGLEFRGPEDQKRSLDRRLRTFEGMIKNKGVDEVNWNLVWEIIAPKEENGYFVVDTRRANPIHLVDRYLHAVNK